MLTGQLSNRANNTVDSLMRNIKDSHTEVLQTIDRYAGDGFKISDLESIVTGNHYELTSYKQLP